MSDNDVTFPGSSPQIASEDDEQEVVRWNRPYTRSGPSMQTVRFRSLKLILETDETDLVRDVRLDLDKAKRKLKKIRERLRSVQKQAETQVGQLTAAENKLRGAIEAAQIAPTDDKSDAYRDLLLAFGKLGSAGQEAIVQYLKTQV